MNKSAIFIFLCAAGVFLFGFAVSVGGLDSIETDHINDQHLRIEAAMHDLRAMRAIRERGIPVRADFIDGTTKLLHLKERSDALSSEESVEFYALPTLEEILGHYGVYGFSTIGSPAAMRGTYASRYDKRAIEKYLNQYFEDKIHSSTPAGYFIEGGKVLISDDAPGQALGLDSFYTELERNLSKLSRETVQLMGVSVPAESGSVDLARERAFADALLAQGGVKISYAGRNWTLPSASLVGMLNFSASSSLLVKTDDLRNFVNKFAQSLVENPVVEPRFTIKDGKIVQVSSGEAGLGFAIDKLARDIDQWLNSAKSEFAANGSIKHPGYFTLTVTKSLPSLNLSLLAQHGIFTRLSSARTSFKGSSKDRIHNIKLGASRVTGRFVMPNEEYSLVRAIGYAERENGYKEEYVIKGDRSKKEAGGGLCQIATTFFRAMIAAGFPVTERHNHRYVVGYYGPGLDAAIYDVSVDLKFKNDTGSPVLVQAFTEGNELVVEFYGRQDGRIAKTKEPVLSNLQAPPQPKYLLTAQLPAGEKKCVEKERAGMSTYAATTVHMPNGRTRLMEWYSRYEPWAQVCFLGAPWGSAELPE